MITDLWIENFKGIGKRQHIPLRPVTLLFGANSAGKSTVLHALLYLRGILRSGNFDPKEPLDGENTVSLGGVDNLIYRKTNDGPLYESFVIEVQFHASLEQVNKYGRGLNRRYVERRCGEARMMYGRRPEDEDKLLQTDDVEDQTVPINIRFEIRSNHGLDDSDSDGSAACLKAIQISIDELPFFDAVATREFFDDQGAIGDENLLGFLNLDHPCWQIPRSNSDQNPRRPFHGLRGSSDLSQFCIEHSVDANQCVLVTDILSLPRFECYKSAGTAEPWRDKLTAHTTVTSLSLGSFREFNAINEVAGASGNLAEAIHEACENDGNCELIFEVPFNAANIESLSTEDLRTSLVGVHFHRPDLPIIDAQDKILEVIGLIRALFSTEVDANRFNPGKCANALFFSWYDIEPTGHPHFDPDGTERDAGRMNLVERQFGLSTHDLVSRAVKGSLTWLREIIDDMIYVGPKRSTVPRNLTLESAKPLTTWGNGLAAWRFILNHPAISKINHWLCERFETNLSLVIKLYREVDTDFDPEELFLNSSRQDAWKEALEGLEAAFHSGWKREIRRLHVKKDNSSKEFEPQDLGEGITQVVPVIAACVKASEGGGLVSIEQPELHLHPSLAARLGDLFLFAASTENLMQSYRKSRLLVETHSEHLILRILRRIRQTTNKELPEHIPSVKPDDVCVLWVDNLGDGTTFTRLRIDEQGEFIDRWPRGFFSERAEELF